MEVVSLPHVLADYRQGVRYGRTRAPTLSRSFRGRDLPSSDPADSVPPRARHGVACSAHGMAFRTHADDAPLRWSDCLLRRLGGVRLDDQNHETGGHSSSQFPHAYGAGGDGAVPLHQKPYVRVRVIWYAGLSLLLLQPWSLALLPVVLIATHYAVVLKEEMFLERHFGDVYRRYKARVPRYW